MRIVLDTNVLVSAFAFPGSMLGRILNAWRAGSFDLAMSDFILQELVRVLPKFVHHRDLTPQAVSQWLVLLLQRAEQMEPDEQLLAMACAQVADRDPQDAPILALLLMPNVDHLVTGDKDLLSLPSEPRILSPAQFCEQYGI